MKGHESIRERLLDLAYGELSRREAREVERHLEGCEACRAELSRIRETRAAMSALGPEPAPEAGERILLAAAREAAERARERRPSPLLPSWVWAGSIGALAVAAVVAVTLRLSPVGPGRRDDPEALLGRSPAAPAASAEPPAPQAPRIEALGPGARQAEPDAAVAKRATPGTRRASPQRPAASEEAPAAVAAAPAPPPAAAKVAVADAEEGTAAAGRGAGPIAASRARTEAASPVAEREALAPAPAAADPVEGWERLDAAGSLERSVRRFDGCREEQVREIDRDPSGRVVRVATLRGSSGWVEQFYGPDGNLAAVRFGRGEARRTVRLGPGVPPPREALPRGLSPRAADVSEEAAPRCE